MFIGDQIVFLRAPKNVTTWTTRTLAMLGLGGFISAGHSLPLPGSSLQMHGPFFQLPRAIQRRYVFGTLRNHYKGLCSYYHYFISGDTHEPRIGFRPFLHLDKNGEPEFKGSLARMLYPKEHGIELDTPLPFIGAWDGRAPVLEWMEELDVGLWTIWHLWVFARDPMSIFESNNIDDIVFRYPKITAVRAFIEGANVRRDLPVILDHAGIEVSSTMQKIIDNSPRANVNRHDAESAHSGGLKYSGNHLEFYDSDMVEWVKDRERFFEQVFGYTLHGGGPDAPLFYDQPESRAPAIQSPLLDNNPKLAKMAREGRAWINKQVQATREEWLRTHPPEKK